MRKLMLTVAIISVGGLGFASPNCIVNLIPPTTASQLCQDGSGQMNFLDSTAGPVTLTTLVNPLNFTPTNIFPTGTTTFRPLQLTNISTNTTITPTATYITLASTGGIVTLGINALVSISTTTAFNGQELILGATQSVNTVVITSGTTSACDLGAATRSISYGKRLGLIFDSVTGYWTELFYGNN